MKPDNILVDTSAFITLFVAKQTGFFRRLSAVFHMTDSIRDEIDHGDQKADLETIESEHAMLPARADELDHLVTYSRLMTRIDSGEASALAFAKDNDWLFACEETNGRFRKEVEATITMDRLVTCTHLFLEAIAEGLMTPTEADAVHARMIAARRPMLGWLPPFVELYPVGRHAILAQQDRCEPSAQQGSAASR